MPKRFNDKQRSIFVKFYQDVPEEEILDEIRKIGISGTRVSSLINRWVLDVPFWKEEEYCEILYGKEIVEKIHENFDVRRKNSLSHDEEFDEQE